MHTLKTGIHSRVIYKQGRIFGLRIESIEHSSNFRDTELPLGGLIKQIDGKPIDEFKNPKGKIETAPTLFNETAYWQEHGVDSKHHCQIEATMDGRQYLVSAPLFDDRVYKRDNSTTIGKNGPKNFEKDGFDTAWGSWYSKVTKRMNLILLDRGRGKSFNYELEMKNLLLEKDRIAYFKEHYPNIISKELLKDYEKCTAILTPKRLSMEEVDLTYRSIQLKIRNECMLRSKENWKKFKANLDGTFSAGPVSTDQFEEEGEYCIETRWLTYSNSITDIGKGYFIVGDARFGMNYIQMNSDLMNKFYDAFFRYKSEVNPKTIDRFRFIGKIVNEPRMLTISEKQVEGLELIPLVAQAGDEECFVDLRNETITFEGEELTEDQILQSPSTNEGPVAFLNYFFTLIKKGYRNQWEACYSDMVATDYFDERYIKYEYCPESKFEKMWQQMRNQLLNEITAIRIADHYPSQTVDNADDFDSFEAYTIWVDYYRQADNHHESFKDMTLFRGWMVLNINNEGWKINGYRTF
ncbi:hypothetical protein [Flagellimonas marina]|uniref:Uncharacterized protein n=1 Tax=Flagellimonas marina TaxID=1775168 RepID=A0ABV8PMG6_9FLAO